MDKVIGRFAPTPSGYAHMGNLFCYFLAWLSAKSQGGQILLRIEDLDTQRTSPALAEETMEDLLWLGLTWDQGPRVGGEAGPYYQSQRTHIYQQALAALEEMGCVYPCFCSRSDVKNANAPHLSDGRTVYPGTCRKLTPEDQARLSALRAPAWRVAVEEETISFTDRLQGFYAQEMTTQCGDFPIRRADGVFCYQLAVVLDDALMGVTEVVRASDLLSSTPQQLYLYKKLQLPAPRFIHIPTVLDPEGNRLAKRSGSTSLRELKQRYSREEILGKLAYLAGLQPTPAPQTLEALLPLFSWDKVPKQDIRLPRGWMNEE